MNVREFNNTLVRSIDETIANLLGKNVVIALHDHLLKFYDISPDEIPYRLDTLTVVLQKTFGLGFKTIERSVAKKLYRNLQLEFYDVPHRSLTDYIEEAKRKLGSC